MINKLNKITNIYKQFDESDICKYLKTDEQNYISNERISFNESFQKAKNELEKIEKGEIPLNVGVFGSFNAGKSSVINSIIGEKLLQVNLEPTTAIVSIIKYGEIMKIRVNYKNGEKKYIDKTELSKTCNHKYDKDGNELIDDKQHEIKFIEVFYPLEILKNVNLIDTPGFSSISKRDDKITKGWLENVDVLLWISDINKGTIDRDELNILNKIRIDMRDKEIIGIINKVDTKPPFKIEKIIKSYSEQFNFNIVIPFSTEGSDFIETVDKFKDYLLYVQNNLKSRKSINTNNNVFAIYKRQIHNMQKLKINIKDIKDIKLVEFKEVSDITSKFTEDFNQYLNLSFKKLTKDLFDDAKEVKSKMFNESFYQEPRIQEAIVDKILELFKGEFINFYEDKIKIFDDFLNDNSFNYNYSKEKEKIEFLCDQIIQASTKAVKTIFEFYKEGHIVLSEDIMKAIIEVALPNDQINNRLQFFFGSEMDNLRKEVIHRCSKNIDDINDIIKNMVGVLV